MATTEEIARDDLRAKILLERDLLNKISPLNRQIVRDFVKKIDDSEVLQAVEYQEDFEQLLNDHYELVGEHFSTRIREDLPEEIEITDNEAEIIAAALGFYFLTRAADQARLITETNQKNIINAVEFGIEEGQREGLSTRERAVVSGAALSRSLKGREQTIANTETQNAAETSKQTEAEVLTGRTPGVSGGVPAPSPVKKTWVTAGDEKVRTAPFDHVSADGQEVSLSEPYIVSGQSLRYPGDTELGASPGNVINCRCGSIEDRDMIMSARFDTREQILQQAATLRGN